MATAIIELPANSKQCHKCRVQVAKDLYKYVFRFGCTKKCERQHGTLRALLSHIRPPAAHSENISNRQENVMRRMTPWVLRRKLAKYGARQDEPSKQSGASHVKTCIRRALPNCGFLLQTAATC